MTKDMLTLFENSNACFKSLKREKISVQIM